MEIKSIAAIITAAALLFTCASGSVSDNTDTKSFTEAAAETADSTESAEDSTLGGAEEGVDRFKGSHGEGRNERDSNDLRC